MTAVSIVAALSAGVGVLAVIDRPSPPTRIEAVAGRSVGRRRAYSEQLGRWLWLGLRRQPHLARLLDDPTPASARRLGRITILTLATAMVDPLVAATLGGAAVVWSLRPALARHTRATADSVDQRSVTSALPDLIDLLVLTTGAGLTVPASIPVVAGSAPPALRPALADVVTAETGGASMEHALDSLGSAWGDAGAPLVHVLADHVRYGTPVISPLERVGVSARLRRRRAAEVRARRLPVLLLFPLVLCTLPAFGLLTVAPLVAGTLGSLDVSPFEVPASTPP